MIIAFQWVDTISVEWLKFVYSGTDTKGNLSSSKDELSRFSKDKKQMYKLAMYHKYTSTRIKQLFNILIGRSFIVLIFGTFFSGQLFKFKKFVNVKKDVNLVISITLGWRLVAFFSLNF